MPILILFGLIFRRWWRLSLSAAALGWPVLLVATDVMSVERKLLGAAGLAIANTGVGLLIHESIPRVSRKLRRPAAPRSRA